MQGDTMRLGYIRVMRSGPSEATQRKALQTVDAHRTVERDWSVILARLKPGDELVVASPACLGTKTHEILLAFDALARMDVNVRVVDPAMLLVLPEAMAPVRRFIDLARRETQVAAAGAARAARPPQIMGGRPSRFARIRGEAIYAGIEAAWRDMTKPAAAVADSSGFSVASLYREFGPRSQHGGVKSEASV